MTDTPTGSDPSGMDGVFRALADPSRRSLLDRLNQHNGQTLGELCAGLAMARQSVSKHLAVLEAAHIVTTARQGRQKLHFLNAAPINAIADRWITQYHRPRAEALADLKTALEFRAMPAVHQQTAFTYTTYIKTTPELLWQALTEPAFTRRYWGVGLISQWTVGSTITWEVEDVTIADPAQVVLIADPPRQLSYTWHTVTPEFVTAVGGTEQELAAMSAENRSTVTFDLEPAGDLVKFTVTHSGFEPGSTILSGVSNGWPSIVASLKTLLETGEPLAFD